MSSTDDKSASVIAVSASMVSIMVAAITLRLYTRFFIIKWLGIDDTLILIAVLLASTQGASSAVATRYGLGRHHEQQKPEQVETYVKLTLVASLSYSAAAMFIKLSLLAFYLRLAPNNRIFIILVYVMIFVSIGFGLGSILTAGLQCIPISMLWDITVKGKCVDINKFYFANAGLNIFTDLMIYGLPIPTLWKLRLPVVQRVGLCVVLGLGGLAVVASVYRITTLRDLLGSPDNTWKVVDPLNWSTIELDIAILATCVPAFKAFLRYYFPTLLGTSRHGDYSFGNTTTRTRNGSRHYSVPLASIAHSERDGTGISHHFQKYGNHTTTTITGDKMFNFKGFGDPTEFVNFSKHGILQHTTVHINHEVDSRAKSGVSSNGSSEVKRPDDQV